MHLVATVCDEVILSEMAKRHFEPSQRQSDQQPNEHP
jgi:hypothetical protein